MTENNTEVVNEATAADKGENTVHIPAVSKEKADAMEKIKRSLKTKKSMTTRTLNRLEAAIQLPGPSSVLMLVINTVEHAEVMHTLELIHQI